MRQTFKSYLKKLRETRTLKETVADVGYRLIGFVPLN